MNYRNWLWCFSLHNKVLPNTKNCKICILFPFKTTLENQRNQKNWNFDMFLSFMYCKKRNEINDTCVYILYVFLCRNRINSNFLILDISNIPIWQISNLHKLFLKVEIKWKLYDLFFFDKRKPYWRIKSQPRQIATCRFLFCLKRREFMKEITLSFLRFHFEAIFKVFILNYFHFEINETLIFSFLFFTLSLLQKLFMKE